MPKLPSRPLADVNGPNAVIPAARITNLDALRGIAVLGILVMNAVSYGLPTAAYFNVSATGSSSPVDKVIWAVGEILIDHKMMGLFSVLFGAGVVLFLDRAERRTTRPILLSLWRNLLLFAIGLVHVLVWEGDVLVVYAMCAPLVIALRKARLEILFGLGAFAVVAPSVLAVWVQSTIPIDGAGLGDFWFVTDLSMSDAVGIYLLADFFGRAFGMMLIGVGLYKLGVLSAERTRSHYVTLMLWGFGIGIPIATVGVAMQVLGNSSPSMALLGEIPNSLATIPIVLGFVGLITLWNCRSESLAHLRLRAVGRMALTNYLMQTVLGIVVLRGLLAGMSLTRMGVAIFVLVVWTLEILWSKPWLDRFLFGPMEWLWRVLTYRRSQPFRCGERGS